MVNSIGLGLYTLERTLRERGIKLYEADIRPPKS